MSSPTTKPTKIVKVPLLKCVRQEMYQEEIDAFGNYIAGLIDGEGYFGLRTLPIQRGKYTGYIAEFQLLLRSDDLPILEKIREFLDCGRIRIRKPKVPSGGRRKPAAELAITNCTDLVTNLIPLLERYPLRSKKSREFPIFKEAVSLIEKVMGRKQPSKKGEFKWTPHEHRHFKQLANKISDIKAYRDPSDPTFVPVPVILQNDLTEEQKHDAFGYWLAGFTDGEAYFKLRWRQRGSRTFCVNSSFSITLRKDDLDIIKQIRDYLKCGGIYYRKEKTISNHGKNLHNKRDQVEISISNCLDLKRVVLPLFEKYPLQAKKARDFCLFKQGVELKAGIMSRGESQKSWKAKIWQPSERGQIIDLVKRIQETRLYQDAPLSLHKEVVQIPSTRKNSTVKGFFDGVEF